MKWEHAETFALIRLYQHMVKLEQSKKLGPSKSKGQTSKALLVRDFIAEHSPEGRSKQSVEMKLMNISYVRQQAGMSLVTGYKPLPNCSSDLLEAYGIEKQKGENN